MQSYKTFGYGGETCMFDFQEIKTGERLCSDDS